MPNSRPYIDSIAALGACSGALDWLRASPHATLSDAWAACERGDWMLWLYGRRDTSAPWSEERKPLVRCAVAVAREALPILEARRPGDGRVRRCLDVTDAWCRGEATVKEARRARTDADANAAYYAAATHAAYTAAAYYAAYYAAYADACAQPYRRSADIVRAMLPCPTLP